MIWEKICGIFLLIFLYLSPLATFSVRNVTSKTMHIKLLIGQGICFISFLLVLILWFKGFRKSKIAFLKDHELVLKVLLTVLMFYGTAGIITLALR